MFKRSPATSPRHLSPNPSPSRSRSNSLPSSSSYAYTPPPSRQVQSEEALRTVKVLEGVLVAWNEYRLAVNQQGRAGRKLAGAMRDLAGRMDRDGVAYKAVNPTSVTLDTIADITVAHSKRLETAYDHAKSEASRYFQNLARQVRDHEAYLSNEGKRAIKSEKAYRKASKVMTEGAIQGSGLEAMKDALKQEVETASEYHANLLGDAQAAILLKISAGLAGIAHPTVAFHSEGPKVSAERLGEIEYFRALSAAQWQDLSLPEAYQTPGESLPHLKEPYPLRSEPNSSSAKGKEALHSEGVRRSYVQPSSPADPQPPAPLRPKLPTSHTSSSSQGGTPPVMRSRNSLPPPPMYASSSSLAIPRQNSSPPSTSSSTFHPQHYTQPLRLPAVTARRRVSDIVALHESHASSSSDQQPTLRRVSMPPSSSSIPPVGPRPRPSRLPTAPVLPTPRDTAPRPSPSTPSTGDPGLRSTTSSAQSSSILTTTLLSPTSASSAPTVDTDPTPGGLKSAMRKPQVTFGREMEQLGSFPWGDTGSEGVEDPWAGAGEGSRGPESAAGRGKGRTEGGGMGVGVLHPSPRRVPSLSPELRGMMSG